MDIEKGKSKNTDPDPSNIEVTEKVEFPSWAEESQDEKPSDYSFTVRGTDMLKVPCFKSTMMYSIGSGMLTGIAYNLGTSRPPGKVAFGTYAVVYFGSWIYCRLNYHKREFEINKLQHAMTSYHLLEGTEAGNKMDEEWLKSKQGEVSKNDPSNAQ